MVEHAKQIAEQLVENRQLNGNDLAVEVASNDGYLLQWYKRCGIPVLGIEPAVNIAHVASETKGVETICDFFGAELAKKLATEGKQASVMHANNVLAHVADLPGVVDGFRALLRPNGLLVVEFPYLGDLICKTEFDTIYHEHLCYFSLMAIDRLFDSLGLRVIDVQRLSIHGGSLRIFAQRASNDCSRSAAVQRLLAEESQWVFDDAVYTDFASRVDSLKSSLLNCLRELKGRGKRIAVYGASAKGSTLLNFFGIGADCVDYVVDRSTVKQGRYTPGTHLRISSPERLVEERPDYCLLLTWNFAEEIMEQQRLYRETGGKFIIPIPELRVA